MAYRTAHVAIAIVRDQDSIVMVEQQGADDPRPYWVLPGGLVEPGELLSETLIRETREEAGIEIQGIGRLAYCCQIDHPSHDAQTIAFGFEVRTWSGSLGSNDPDGEIVQVAWVSVADAMERLGNIGWRGMREPLLAYLRGEHSPGAVWLYREDMDDQVCLACLAAPG